MTELQIKAASELEAYLMRCIEEQRESTVSMPTGCGGHSILATALNNLTEAGKRVIYASPVGALRDQMVQKIGSAIELQFPVMSTRDIGDMRVDLVVYESWYYIPTSLAKSTVRYR